MHRVGKHVSALLNKPHNGRLAALSPEVTHARRELEYIVGFDREEIQLSLHFTVGKVCSLLLRVQSATLNAQWVWHVCQFLHFGNIQTILPDRPGEIQCNGTETIMNRAHANSAYNVHCTDIPRGRYLV